MKYLCLVYFDEKKLDTVADDESKACGDALRQSGHHIAAEAPNPFIRQRRCVSAMEKWP